MADSAGSFFDDTTRSQNLALGLGALGGPLIAIGLAVESVPVLVIGAIALVGSGAVWTIRGIKEDQISPESE